MPAEFHRKIELQSPDDLQYLVNNIRRAADAEIERNLPRMEEEKEDDMRLQVERIIEDYIKTLLQTSAQNITINGLPATEGNTLTSILANAPNAQSIEEHEPFNGKLFNRAKDLAVREEELIEEIARMRREVPARVVEERRMAWREVEGGDEGVLNGLGVGDGGEKVAFDGGERRDEVEGSWGRGVQGLERIVGSLPGGVAKKERAERVESHVRGAERR